MVYQTIKPDLHYFHACKNKTVTVSIEITIQNKENVQLDETAHSTHVLKT